MSTETSPCPQSAALHRERRLAAALLVASIVIWAIENALTLSGIPFFPVRQMLLFAWYACLFAPVAWVAWRHRSEDRLVGWLSFSSLFLVFLVALLDVSWVYDVIVAWIPGATRDFWQGVQHLLLGAAAGSIALCMSLSTIKTAEQAAAARQLLEEARAASRAKSDFLARMSHEIRTPLTAILGFSEVLAEKLAGEEEVDAANTIQRNGEHLQRLIDDILDLSRIEAGMVVVERSPCSPIEVLQDVHAMMRNRAAAKGIDLQVQFSELLPEKISSDMHRIRQVLINLVGNAVKFTEAGSVVLSATVLETQQGECHVEFSVSDTGLGMSPEQLQRVFDPFAQADESVSRRFGGAGLGLSISRRLVELLGGELHVESLLGSGSTFYFSLPIGRSEAATDGDEPTSPAVSSDGVRSAFEEANQGKGMHVLVVEDGADNQRLISRLLSGMGAETSIAENGRIGVELAIQAASEGRAFDAILMDIQMPIMDGYAATRSLRDRHYRGRIIALTAHAMEEDRRKCLEAGCDAFAAKPIRRDELMQLLLAE